MTRDITPTSNYQPRVVDEELQQFLAGLPAVSLEGPKGVGKTVTASRIAQTAYRLDDPSTLELVRAQSDRLCIGAEPILVDEWQRYPPAWDVVRRTVDADPRPGRFVLTGSATPERAGTHSGAGRIVTLRMRPLTLPERGIEVPTVSLQRVLTGSRPEVEGSTVVNLDAYVKEILAGGFPGMRPSSDRARRAALNGYLDRIVDTEIPELGVQVRHPGTLRRWLSAYAAATATTASYDTIRDAASTGEGGKPAKTTTIPYREALERIWILEPLQAWAPTNNHLSRLTFTPKHHLVDPALAARLSGISSETLLSGKGPEAIPRDGTFLGSLFESLTTMSLRVFAQASEARVFHFRTKGGEREVDLIVERDDHRIVAIEVKLSATVDDKDVKHLLWLREQLGENFLDGIVITTGAHAYRRTDGIAVVPLALLGT